MKTLGKAGVFLCLMVGLTLWAAALFSQQGALGASTQPPAGQGEQGAQDEDRPSRQADRSLDRVGQSLDSASVIDVTASYTMFLPTVLSSFCVPSAPGESNNIADALVVCSGQTVSGWVDDSDKDDVYKILTVANQHLTISMDGTGSGDADLYLYPPGTNNVYTDPPADWSAYDGNSEYLSGTVLVGGYWYIDVYDYGTGNGGTNYNLTATLSGPGAAGTRAFDLPESDRLRDRGGPKGSD